MFWANSLHFIQAYTKYVVTGYFIEGLLDSTNQSMSSLWGSNKHVTVQDLAHHENSLTSLWIGSRTRGGTSNSNMQENRRDNKRSQKAAARILNTDERLISRSYSTSDTPKTALLMIMQPTRSLEGPTLGTSFLYFTGIASSVDKVDYCPLWLLRPHVASTHLQRDEAIQNLTMNHKNVYLAGLLSRTLLRPGNRRLRCSCATIPNSFYILFPSLRGGGEARTLTSKSVTVKLCTGSPTQPISIPMKSSVQMTYGRWPSHYPTIYPIKRPHRVYAPTSSSSSNNQSVAVEQSVTIVFYGALMSGEGSSENIWAKIEIPCKWAQFAKQGTWKDHSQHLEK